MEWKKWPEKIEEMKERKNYTEKLRYDFMMITIFFSLFATTTSLHSFSLSLSVSYTPPPNKTKCQFVSKFYLGLNFFWVRTRWHISLPTTVPKQTHAYNLVREKKIFFFILFAMCACVYTN